MRFLIQGIFLFFFISYQSLAQELRYLNHRCQAEDFLLESIEANPRNLNIFHIQEKAIRDFLANKNFSIQRSEIIIPVVIHIVYRTDEQNISDLQVLDQLDILNRAFSKENKNLYTVPPQFRTLISNVGIQFCLARLDPDGKPTNGIIRKPTSVENIGTKRADGIKVAVHFDEYGGSNSWDTERYLNIWVAEMESNIAGSATFPNMAPYPEADGIIMNYRYFGSIGTAIQSTPYDKGKTLIHEVGHYFNLFHPWGPGFGGCETDDFVDDTPLQEGPYFDCNPLDNFSCGSEDIVVNFMDYTEDACLAMFTNGQKERMLASIQLFRSNLINNQSACHNSEDTTTNNSKDFLIVKPERIDQIFIYSPEKKVLDFTVEIYTIGGKEVWREQLSQTSFHTINVSTLSRGVYIVCITTSEYFNCSKIPVF
ncbi:MAG: T9SS C-terminal target domain-containing protein [Saprospirales bacterium]|nr:MAG: T9SS C-terminal target domain-containing protein [Saprospirales bacterium]